MRAVPSIVVVVVGLVELAVRDDLAVVWVDTACDLDVALARAPRRRGHGRVVEQTVVIIDARVCDSHHLALAGDAVVPDVVCRGVPTLHRVVGVHVEEVRLLVLLNPVHLGLLRQPRDCLLQGARRAVKRHRRLAL